MMNERPNIVDQDNEFVQHSYNALYGGKLDKFEDGLQREMVLVVADHMLNQMDPAFKKEFLEYIRKRVEVN